MLFLCVDKLAIAKSYAQVDDANRLMAFSANRDYAVSVMNGAGHDVTLAIAAFGNVAQLSNSFNVLKMKAEQKEHHRTTKMMLLALSVKGQLRTESNLEQYTDLGIINREAAALAYSTGYPVMAVHYWAVADASFEAAISGDVANLRDLLRPE